MRGMDSRLRLVIVATLSLVLVSWIGSFSAGAPTLPSPLPLLTVLPAFVLSTWHLGYVATLIPSVLFFF